MDQFIEQLRNNGLKITPKRLAIIEFFLQENRSLSPEEVWLPLKGKFGHLGLPSIYRNLETLTGCGILTKIQRFDNKRHYAICHDHAHHHHHIVCRECGRVDHFEDCQLEHIKKVKGFKVLKHFVQLEGICSACQ